MTEKRMTHEQMLDLEARRIVWIYTTHGQPTTASHVATMHYLPKSHCVAVSLAGHLYRASYQIAGCVPFWTLTEYTNTTMTCMAEIEELLK